jgi:hypothetical protein
MCVARQPATADAALVMLEAALDCLNSADVGSLPAAAQADCLRVLERAEAGHTAARAAVLAAFTAQGGFEDDGQQCARSWLTWQTRVAGGAAAGAVGWVRRLAAHPAVDGALAADPETGLAAGSTTVLTMASTVLAGSWRGSRPGCVGRQAQVVGCPAQNRDPRRR